MKSNFDLMILMIKKTASLQKINETKKCVYPGNDISRDQQKENKYDKMSKNHFILRKKMVQFQGVKKFFDPLHHQFLKFFKNQIYPCFFRGRKVEETTYLPSSHKARSRNPLSVRYFSI